MTLVMVLLTMAVVAGVAAVAAGLVSGGLAEPVAPIPARALPDQPLTGQDVVNLRFVQAFRGYRMDQVDAAMDQLAAEVDRLRGLLGIEDDPAGETDGPLAVDDGRASVDGGRSAVDGGRAGGAGSVIGESAGRGVAELYGTPGVPYKQSGADADRLAASAAPQTQDTPHPSPASWNADLR